MQPSLQGPGPVPETGTPAPYGRACSNCARAKCKCIYRQQSGSCERCHRLRKACTPSTSVRRRGGKRRMASRTTILEEKLDGLVAMLRSQASSSGPHPPSLDLPAYDAAHAHPTPSTQSPTDVPNHSIHDSSENASPDGRSDQTAPPPHRRSSLLWGMFDPDDIRDPRPATVPISSLVPFPNTPALRLEAEESLQAFRTTYLPYFPCVHIPPSVTAETLREQRPMLWLSIIMITCQSTPLQLAMIDCYERILGQKMVVEHDDSMDVLLSILVFLGWSHYHRRDKYYLSLLCQLALSTIYDLALHRPSAETSVIFCFKSLNFPKAPRSPKERTAEDYRTVLACFLVTSNISYITRRIEGLAWTPYMEVCLDELLRQADSPLDEVLISQVKLQLVLYQLHRAPWQHSGPQEATTGPPLGYLDALHSRIEAVKMEMPQLEGREHILHLQYYHTRLAVYESALSQIPCSSINPDFRRYDICTKYLGAAKSWFDVFFSVPSGEWPRASFHVWCQMAHCLVNLYKLSTLDEPAWDRNQVMETINVIEICDRFVAENDAVLEKRRLASAGQQAGDEDTFLKYTRMLRAVRASWAADLAKLGSSTSIQAPAGGGVNEFIDGVTTGPMAMPTFAQSDHWTQDTMWLADVFNVAWE